MALFESCCNQLWHQMPILAGGTKHFWTKYQLGPKPFELWPNGTKWDQKWHQDSSYRIFRVAFGSEQKACGHTFWQYPKYPKFGNSYEVTAPKTPIRNGTKSPMDFWVACWKKGFVAKSCWNICGKVPGICGRISYKMATIQLAPNCCSKFGYLPSCGDFGQGQKIRNPLRIWILS